MKFLTSLVLLIFVNPIFAADTAHKHDHSHKDHKKAHTVSAKKVAKDQILVKVSGMVCSFCAQGIEKNFKKKAEVKETKVDLDKMEVRIFFNPGKTLSTKDIEKVITGAGFKFIGVK